VQLSISHNYNINTAILRFKVKTKDKQNPKRQDSNWNMKIKRNIDIIYKETIKYLSPNL